MGTATVLPLQLVSGGLFLISGIFALVNLGREGHCVHFWLMVFALGESPAGCCVSSETKICMQIYVLASALCLVM